MQRSHLIDYLSAEGYSTSDLAVVPVESEIVPSRVIEICESLHVWPPWNSIPIQFQAYPPFREGCNACLALQGGSIFADFLITPDSEILLVRISFDGYGCCPLENPPIVDKDDRNQFLALLRDEELDAVVASQVLRRYFGSLRTMIWADAVEEYGLIDRAA